MHLDSDMVKIASRCWCARAFIAFWRTENRNVGTYCQSLLYVYHTV